MARPHMSKQLAEKAELRRADILQFLLDHPGARTSEIAAHFRLNPSTVTKHVNLIREGWRPGSEPAE